MRVSWQFSGSLTFFNLYLTKFARARSRIHAYGIATTAAGWITDTRTRPTAMVARKEGSPAAYPQWMRVNGRTAKRSAIGNTLIGLNKEICNQDRGAIFAPDRPAPALIPTWCSKENKHSRNHTPCIFRHPCLLSVLPRGQSREATEAHTWFCYIIKSRVDDVCLRLKMNTLHIQGELVTQSVWLSYIIKILRYWYQLSTEAVDKPGLDKFRRYRPV
jgi:hypothetical protein